MGHSWVGTCALHWVLLVLRQIGHPSLLRSEIDKEGWKALVACLFGLPGIRLAIVHHVNIAGVNSSRTGSSDGKHIGPVERLEYLRDQTP